PRSPHPCPTRRASDLVFSHLGEAGLLCEHAPGPLDLARQRRIWAVADAIGARPGIREVIPGMNNLVVLYDPLAFAPDDLSAEIEDRKSTRLNSSHVKI